MPQTWVVGLDLGERSDGAVRFAAWLYGQARGTRLIGVHVLEPEVLAATGALAPRPQIRERLRLAAEQSLERAGVRAAFAGVEVTEADDAVAGLEAARAAQGAHGMILGRRAAGTGEELIRLGSVARRLLRRLDAPTFIVPPDVEAERMGEGPVVVALTPTEASRGAAAAGLALATATCRTAVFVQVADLPHDHEGEREAPMPGGELHTRAWLAEQGFAGQLIIRTGEERAEILGVAAEQAAPFVVCGSRHLSKLERFLGFSLSSSLAAQAPIPVLVVPSDAPAR